MKRAALILFLALLAGSCSPQKQEAKQAAAPPAAAAKPLTSPAPAEPSGPAAPAENGPAPPPAYIAALPAELQAVVDRAFTGDLDEMVQHRIIRVGAPFNRTFYFMDKGVQRGLAYEYAVMFEDQLNKKLNTGPLKVHVVMLPMPRDMLLPQLKAGKIDMAVAQLTVTPERQKLVDFTNPTRSNVDEVLVTGPGAPAVTTLDGLRSKVFVRKSSSYYATLQAYNREQKAKGKPTIGVEPASESLEDDDLLEMVNAGLIPATVVDNYLADYWKQVFPNLSVHHDMALRTGGNLAVAIRKGNPKLAAALNEFIAKNGLNSAIGATLNKRYLQNTAYVKDAASDAERKKFLQMVNLFQRYGGEYDFDYLLMAAQAYQESRLDQNAKSHVGAIGIMQLMPATGAEQKVGDIRQLEPNIHAGVKYMRFMRNQYFQNEPMNDLNKALFTFASYNAGAGRVRQLRAEAAQRGLNPNVWFGNVERVASERIGRETVTYVGNIYKYYLAYRLIMEEKQRRSAARNQMAEAAQKK
ncbi:MAG TPA: transporter substrate-binding domain-containing protein [Phenylobacterium sp.]|jgi:membrane-bound lytic murein transglycosylase MltF